MTLLHRTGRSAEIELKLGLPMADPAQLVPALLRVPALARCAPEHRQVHNIYYDTPDRRLQAQRMALRIRRVGPDEAPQWLQTLKTADSGHSALSQRGEWEVSVPGPVLLQAVLREAPPWRHFDPEGRVFQALTPCFSTVFERTVWTVQGRDGSAIEVALDRGQITAGPHSAPLHELELELLAGPPAALFALARQIARRLAVLPLAASKAQRGQALRDGVLAAPRRASPPPLRHLSNGAAMARPVLGEMLGQFGANLYLLATEDDPEVVHQARVGWRRFRSALRLFRPLLNPPDPRLWQGLQPLLERLGALRDIDVAHGETLPPLQAAYVAGDAARARAWQSLEQGLAQAAIQGREAVRKALHRPAVGASLLELTAWLETLDGPGAPSLPEGRAPAPSAKAVRHWTRQRLVRLHTQWTEALRDGGHPEGLHRARILAKRLRYNIEALAPLLPARVQRWQQQASQWQTDLGTTRDVLQAGALAQRLGAEPGLVQFLRGFAAGREGLSRPQGVPGGV